MGIISGLANLTRSALVSFGAIKKTTSGIPTNSNNENNVDSASLSVQPHLTVTTGASSSQPASPRSPATDAFLRFDIANQVTLPEEYITTTFNSTNYSTLLFAIESPKLGCTIRVLRPHVVVVSEVTKSGDMKKGDVIVEINGAKPGKWLYDVTNQLKAEPRPLELKIFRFKGKNGQLANMLMPLPTHETAYSSPSGGKALKEPLSPMTSLLVLQASNAKNAKDRADAADNGKKKKKDEKKKTPAKKKAVETKKKGGGGKKAPSNAGKKKKGKK
jgi:hypothetical protein